MKITWETNTYRQIYQKLSQSLDPLAGQPLKPIELRHRGDFCYRKNDEFCKNVASIKEMAASLLQGIGSYEELDSYFNITLDQELLGYALYGEFLGAADLEAENLSPVDLKAAMALETFEKRMSEFVEKPFSIIPLIYRGLPRDQWVTAFKGLKASVGIESEAEANSIHSNNLNIEKKYLIELARTELFKLSNKDLLASQFYNAVEMNDPKNIEKTLLRLLILAAFK